MYVSKIGKFSFLPVEFNNGVYTFPEINEWHIIAGFYEDGQKKNIAHSDITEIETYAMNNDVDLNLVEDNLYHPPGRTFDFVEIDVVPTLGNASSTQSVVVDSSFVEVRLYAHLDAVGGIVNILGITFPPFDSSGFTKANIPSGITATILVDPTNVNQYVQDNASISFIDAFTRQGLGAFGQDQNKWFYKEIGYDMAVTFALEGAGGGK